MKQKLKMFFIFTMLASLIAFSHDIACSQEKKSADTQKITIDYDLKGDLLALTNAPDFTIKDLEGKPVSSADLKGKVVLLHFWATWCHYCRKEIAPLNKLFAKYEKQGVVFLAVSLDRSGPATVRALMKKTKINYPVAMGDTAISKAFGNIRGLPTTFMISPEWQIYKHHRGYVPQEVLEGTIKEMLNNKS